MGERFLEPNGMVVADQTFNAAWRSGTLTADPDTDIITLNGHGFTDGMPVEFDEGTGVLPAGIAAYDDDVSVPAGPGGHYYNVISATANTFQICDTVGGASAVDIIDAGTLGWKVRLAGVTSCVLTGLNLDEHLEYDIFIYWHLAKLTTAVNSFYLRLNNDANMKYYHGTTWDATILSPCATVSGKYSKMLCTFRLTKKNGLLMISRISDGGQHSTDKSTASSATSALGNALINDSGVNVTSLAITTSNNTIALLRNGVRIMVVRRS